MDLRSYQSNASGSAPTAPASPSVGFPQGGVSATRPGAYWFHQVGEELRNILTVGGVTPNNATLTQLKQALDAIYLNKSIGGTVSANLIATGSLTSQGGLVYCQAAPGSNAHFWFNNESGVTQGILYWRRSSDEIVIERANAAGSAAEGYFALNNLRAATDLNLRIVGSDRSIEFENGGNRISRQRHYAGGGSVGAIEKYVADAAGANERMVFQASHGGATQIIGPGPTGGSVSVNNVGLITIAPVGAEETLFLGTGVVRAGADNTKNLGNGTVRWGTLFAATGTINTSDPTLKTEMRPLMKPSDALSLVRRMGPMLYKWIEGGNDIVQEPDGFDEVEAEDSETYDEESQEAEMETVTTTQIVPEFTIENGKAIARIVEKTIEQQRPKMQAYPLFDEAGQPVMRIAKFAQPEVRAMQKNEAGQDVEVVVQEATPDVFEQVMHHVPVLVTKTVQRTRMVKKIEQRQKFKDVIVPRPGRRTHAGFNAWRIEDLFKLYGIEDCGALVKDFDTGIRSLRPDQLIPFLAAAVGGLAQAMSDAGLWKDPMGDRALDWQPGDPVPARKKEKA